jgi:hypothetical protein
MKTKTLLVFFFLATAIIFGSCKKETPEDPQIFSFTGKVQKGPFITGTSITLHELNENLGQTGSSYTTNIASNDGSFSLNNVELDSELALLTANGYFYSEVFGEVVTSPISLQAIVDLSDQETVNINVLTHIAKSRIEQLVNSGMSFNTAQTQAQNELLAFIGVTDALDVDFANLDIVGSATYNGMLLAFSVMLQRYTQQWQAINGLSAELTQLLSSISEDFMPDGVINNQAIIDTLMYNISQLRITEIKSDLEDYYSDMGITVSVPDFENYIWQFQEAQSDTVYTEIMYPDSANPCIVMSPDGELRYNILVVDDNAHLEGFNQFTIAAIVPFGSNLTIKFVLLQGEPSFDLACNSGWDFVNEYPNGFTIHAQNYNQLISTLLYLNNYTVANGSARIEFYENGDTSPTYTKHITWDCDL